MAQFLRDEILSNITVTEDLINQLIEVLDARASALQQVIPEGEKDNAPLLMITIRFDGRGYRVFTKEDLLRYFRGAKEIERLIITIETPNSIRSSQSVGEYLEIRLEKNVGNPGYLTVSADNSDWMESSYSAVHDVLSKFKNKHGLARSAWSTLAIQIIGVITGFALSLWVASNISSHLAIENPFIITFLFVFLLFSNIWGLINAALLNYVHSLFPNIKFYRADKDRIHWLKKTIIGGLALTFILYLLNFIFYFIGDFFSEILK